MYEEDNITNTPWDKQHTLVAWCQLVITWCSPASDLVPPLNLVLIVWMQLNRHLKSTSRMLWVCIPLSHCWKSSSPFLPHTFIQNNQHEDHEVFTVSRYYSSVSENKAMKNIPVSQVLNTGQWTHLGCPQYLDKNLACLSFLTTPTPFSSIDPPNCDVNNKWLTSDS